MKHDGPAIMTGHDGQDVPKSFNRTAEMVPARMLNEYAYCPRLAYLEWVQGEFADTVDTIEGGFQQRQKAAFAYAIGTI